MGLVILFLFFVFFGFGSGSDVARNLAWDGDLQSIYFPYFLLFHINILYSYYKTFSLYLWKALQ